MNIFQAGFGIPIIENACLTVTKERIEQRSWRERLFTLPWRPWIKQKMATYREPDPNVYCVSGRFYCHPAIADMIRQLASASE